jgi:hypothetical protein
MSNILAGERRYLTPVADRQPLNDRLARAEMLRDPVSRRVNSGREPVGGSLSRVKLDRLTPSCLANAANGTSSLPTSAAKKRPERGAAARREWSVFGAGASF